MMDVGEGRWGEKKVEKAYGEKMDVEDVANGLVEEEESYWRALLLFQKVDNLEFLLSFFLPGKRELALVYSPKKLSLHSTAYCTVELDL